MMTVDDLYNRLRVLRAAGGGDEPVKVWVGQDAPRGVGYNVTNASSESDETWLEISQEDVE